MVFFVFAINYINNKIAFSRATELIKVINKYNSDLGAYPDNLEALIPDYIKSIPSAKITLSDSEFLYFYDREKTLLLFTVLPPFGRRVYSFNMHKWQTID